MIAGRIAVTVLAIIVVELAACGVAAAPFVWYWLWVVEASGTWPTSGRIALLAASAAPSYAGFAIALLMTSAVTARLTGARTPPRREMRIRDFEWPLLTWARYMASIHVARLFAGPLVRGSPVWTAYLRANGARIGRRVYINTLSISDHNLLDFGDDVVIGADVHISGHTVEHGIVRTGIVRLGRNVTIGLGSVIDIDVVIPDECQVGALSLVPKHTVLESAGIYVGVPVAPLQSSGSVRRSG